MLPYRSSESLHPPVITTPAALYHFTARPEQFSYYPAMPGILCRQLDDDSRRLITALPPDTLVIVGNTPFWQELGDATTYNSKPAPTNELALCRALCQHCTQVHTRQTDQNIATRLALALQRHARKLRYKRSQPICFFVMQRHCPDRRRTSWFHSIEQHPIAPPVRATSPTDTDTASACASPTPATHRMRPETDKRPGTTDAATTIAPARPMQRAKHSRQLEHAEQIPNRRQAATLAELLGLRAFGSSPITAEQLVQELRLPTTVPCPPAAAGGDDGTPHPKRRKKKHAMPTIYEETMPWQHNMTEWGPISSFTVSTWLLGSRFSLEFDLVAAATTPECAPSPKTS